MTRIFSSLVVGLIFFISSFSALSLTQDKEHPYHLSNFHINYNTNNNNYEIYITCFTNDLERAVKNKLILNDSTNNDFAIDTYLYKHFKIEGLKLVPLLKDIGVESSSLYYYTDTLTSKSKQINIFCDFLYNDFAEQANFFHFNKNKKSLYSTKIIYPQNSLSYPFN